VDVLAGGDPEPVDSDPSSGDDDVVDAEVVPRLIA
jgi:hypothetical protein